MILYDEILRNESDVREILSDDFESWFMDQFRVGIVTYRPGKDYVSVAWMYAGETIFECIKWIEIHDQNARTSSIIFNGVVLGKKGSWLPVACVQDDRALISFYIIAEDVS